MLLNVENLRVSYGNIKALHGISFTIDAGEIDIVPGAGHVEHQAVTVGDEQDAAGQVAVGGCRQR